MWKGAIITSLKFCFYTAAEDNIQFCAEGVGPIRSGYRQNKPFQVSVTVAIVLVLQLE